MPKLELTVEVNNPDEIIAKEKGRWIGLASKLLSFEKRKAKVEEEVYLSLRKELAETLTQKLLDQGVDSLVNIKIIE